MQRTYRCMQNLILLEKFNVSNKLPKNSKLSFENTHTLSVTDTASQT